MNNAANEHGSANLLLIPILILSDKYPEVGLLDRVLPLLLIFGNPSDLMRKQPNVY